METPSTPPSPEQSQLSTRTVVTTVLIFTALPLVVLGTLIAIVIATNFNILNWME